MSLLISASISALTALDIFIISSSVMDIFCDKSGVVQIKSRQPSRYYLRNWFQSQT
jgi:hypothetical protein